MRGLVACVLASVLTACVHGSCPASAIVAPEMAYGSLRKPKKRIEVMRAEATVDQRGKDGRVKGRVLMFAERPDHLRFDVMTQFGPALVLTADGAQLALNDLKQGRFFAGPSCARNISRLIGVALEPRDVVSVLLGEAPALPDGRESVQCGKGGAYELVRVDPRGERQVIELAVLPQDQKKPAAEQHTYLRAVHVYGPNGRPLYRVRYEDYGDVGHGIARFPYTIRIEDLANDADALVRFRSIDVNVTVPAGAFAQEPPGALMADELSCE